MNSRRIIIVSALVLSAAIAAISIAFSAKDQSIVDKFLGRSRPASEQTIPVAVTPNAGETFDGVRNAPKNIIERKIKSGELSNHPARFYRKAGQ